MEEPTLAALHPLILSDIYFSKLHSSRGIHGSFRFNLPRTSRSLELSRAYAPGDSVRHIDWKMYARSNQLIVRQQREEALAKVIIYLDSSPSMDWPNEGLKNIVGKVPRKFEVAARVAFNLVYRHKRMGDQTQLILLESQDLEDNVLCFTPNNPSEVLSAFDYCMNGSFQIETVKGMLKGEHPYLHNTHLIYWIGDLCSLPFTDEVFEHTHRFCLFHLLSHLEKDPSWMEDKTCYFDQSSKFKEYLGQDLKAKNKYIRKIEKWCETIEHEVTRKGGMYLSFTDKSSLQNYFAGLEALASW
ncbi:MAG: DUF58 domain-containing protein [Deltaproteobacteria bacterium]|nr:DUF58 domain-containing protein [Deltaproteobacteria bacterium]